jgi:hypothetical protein
MDVMYLFAKLDILSWTEKATEKYANGVMGISTPTHVLCGPLHHQHLATTPQFGLSWILCLVEVLNS